MIIESIVLPPLVHLRDAVLRAIPVYSFLSTNASDSAVGRVWFRKVFTCRVNVLPSIVWSVSRKLVYLLFTAVLISRATFLSCGFRPPRL